MAKYAGTERQSLLRWLVELDAAIQARNIEDDSLRVIFAMSNLAGRAKTWAFGRRLADPACFRSLPEFKRELRAVFEPPKTEFRARAEFLDLKQGKRDIHAYSQYARYLVSCIVADPVDDSTQVVTFMKGLIDGPVKTHLFREYPRTLEEAISLALQEDFSLQQAYVHSDTYRAPRARQVDDWDEAEPMDLSAIEPRRARSNSVVCHRCQKNGHMAYECMAPRPIPKKREGQSSGQGAGRQGPRKNPKSVDRKGSTHQLRQADDEDRPWSEDDDASDDESKNEESQ
jgi:hypothetical protein